MAVVEPNSIPEGLAFDDVLLRPGLSAVACQAQRISRRSSRRQFLNLPIISATAMEPAITGRFRNRHGEAGGIVASSLQSGPPVRPRKCARSKRFERDGGRSDHHLPACAATRSTRLFAASIGIRSSSAGRM